MVARFRVGGLAVVAAVCLGGAAPAMAQGGGRGLSGNLDNLDFEKS